MPGRDRTTLGRGPYLLIEVRSTRADEAEATKELDLVAQLLMRARLPETAEVAECKVRNAVRKPPPATSTESL